LGRNLLGGQSERTHKLRYPDFRDGNTESKETEGGSSQSEEAGPCPRSFEEACREAKKKHVEGNWCPGKRKKKKGKAGW